MSHLVEIPELETERLRLRVPLREEFSAYRDLMTGPRGVHIGEYDAQSAWREYASDAGHWVLYGYGAWHILRKDNGDLIGGVGLLNQDFYPEVELGWHLYEGFEGHGYITEAATAARDWAFQTHGFSTLVSYIDRDNARSIAVAERLGAQEDPSAQKVDPEDVVFRHLPVFQ
ncbi:MAG: GNAT family N-acetyltransferase [Pseudomonadota bacterium]